MKKVKKVHVANKISFISLLLIWTVSVHLHQIYVPDAWTPVVLGELTLTSMSTPDLDTIYYPSGVNDAPDFRFTFLGNILLYLVSLSGAPGLQIFRILCVLTTCLFLLLIIKKYNYWVLLALFICVLATLQKQQIRNAIFALPFCSAMMWMFFSKRYFWIPVLLGLWSCIHGSYILGFGILLLLVIGETLDNKRANITQIVVLIASFMLISYNNPQIYGYANIFKQAASADFAKPVTAFNQTIFKPSGVVSADFLSPFKVLRQWHVSLSLFCIIAGGLFFMFAVRFKWVYWIVFGSVCFFGLGYVRLIGYVAPVGVALLFVAYRKNDILFSLPDRRAFIMCLCACMLWILNICAGTPFKPMSQYAFGFGTAPWFSKRFAEQVLKDYPDNNIFTTITTGGYLLRQWYPKKKVFFDSFFYGHPKENLKLAESFMFDGADPNELLKYGLTVACLGIGEGQANLTFLKHPDWRLKIMDLGILAYEYKPPSKIVKVLFSKAELKKLNKNYVKILTHYIKENNK